MKDQASAITEAVQKLAAKVLATGPAGEGLCLIGGFRYRLLDGSCRRSLDLDYHWNGNLVRKQGQVTDLLGAKLAPLIRQRMGYESNVAPAIGPAADGPSTRTVELAIWRPGGALGRMTIPVDITRIPCADKPIARTAEGTVYLSVSDADMAESKVLALFNRTCLQERDILDLFLFQERLLPDSAVRIRHKLARLRLTRARVAVALGKMTEDRAYHIRNLEAILKGQVDDTAAANLRRAGGAAMVFDQVVELLKGRLRIHGSARP